MHNVQDKILINCNLQLNMFCYCNALDYLSWAYFMDVLQIRAYELLIMIHLWWIADYIIIDENYELRITITI